MWLCCILVGFLALPNLSWGATSGEEDTVRRAAAEIDRAFAEAAENSIRSCSDKEFVRRAYLEIIGRIPTAEECREFLESKERGKRAALTDRLLETPGHTSRMFNFWVDLLRLRTKLNTLVSGAPYTHWLKESVSTNKPYDQMVRELLTAEGPAHERNNGATGYFMRDRGMPEDNMANTLRTFLGTRIECAQCHDHPFDEWTQRQFFEMTAFTGGMEFRVKLKDLPSSGTYLEISRELRQEGGDGAVRAIRRMLLPTLEGVYGSGTGLVRLPKDYQYEDAKPREYIQANAIFGDPLRIDNAPPESTGMRRNRQRKPSAVGSRAEFADWITAPTNPYFTKSIVNRLWKRIMGRGLIEPVDTLDLNSEASNPKLLARLEQLMIDTNYDIDMFLRVIYRTDAWQARAVVSASEGVQPDGPLMHRMSAEQVWDSLLTLLVEDLDDSIDESGEAQAEEVYETYDRISNASEDEVRELVDRASMRMTDRDAFRKERVTERKAANAERRKLMKEHPALMRDLRRARRAKDRAAEKRALAALEEVGISFKTSKAEREMRRASELSLPAPNGHFLRQFGQSDHEQIDGAHTEASIPQALSLLNGTVETALVQNGGAVISREIANAEGANKKIEAGFLSVLGREPSRAELKLWSEDFRTDETRASQDLIWTLVNSHEFLFVR